jgi:pyruvate kinase
MLAGMNVARLNFSHGTYDEHRQKIAQIRSIAEELNKPVAILQDLRGPKIRVGNLAPPGIELKPGNTVYLTTRIMAPGVNRVPVSYGELPDAVTAGDRILLADGLMELVVRAKMKTEIECEVITGGLLTARKGINLPTGTIKAEALTDKDKEDLAFGLAHDVDYVALSFVRQAQDVQQVRRITEAAGKRIPIIAKIEKHEALTHIDAILEVADGIMVARGDLGVEIPLEKVPGIQKKLIRKANLAGLPVIIATQMLRSMIDAPRPTRAEAADVANAVLDGTDAVMLSEETATGKYPVEAVKFMTKIAANAECFFPHRKYLELLPKKEISESVAYAACILADHLEADAIVATSRSGFTAGQVSRFKPRTPIIALSPESATIRKLSLFWGCLPHLTDAPKDTDELFENTALAALQTGAVAKGDLVIITAGHPVWKSGTTKILRVKRL